MKIWEEGKMTNLFTFDDSKHGEELLKNIRISTKVTAEVLERIISIVKIYR